MISIGIAIFVTIGIYYLGLKIHQKFPYPIINPTLISIICLIFGLFIFDISYETYYEGGKWLSKLLEFGIVALGFPLYQQFTSIRKDLLALFIVIGSSALLAIFSTVMIAFLLGAEKMLVISLAPHSVTTPIAVAITDSLGGSGALAAMSVLLTGFIGALFGVPLLKIFGIHSAKAQGIAIGTSTHALGTSTIMKEGEVQGAYSALALVLCAIITAILAPITIPWLVGIVL